MALDLGKLNKEQREAVEHGNGPLLIVAGAGTGKTTVITQRIVNLIEKGLAKPEEILAVTFTEKAAAEMEERVDRFLDIGYLDLWISTFHAFCERVLRDHALDIGLPPDFKILDQTAGWLLTRQNLDKFELDYYRALGNPTKFIQALISHFSHCKDQEIYPEDYLKYAESLKTRDDLPEDSETERIKEVADAYHVYQKILLDNNCLDFGDLINYCLKLFKTRPLILKKYHDKFKYILVDEFQDTNWSQYELIKLLAAKKPACRQAGNLCVCADDDQAIYRWRGASFSNIVQFKRDFPDARQISLIKNYRSPQNILDLAYKFIQANNPDRLECMMDPVRNGVSNGVNKRLAAENTGPGIIEHICAKSLDEEAGLIVKKILEIFKRDGSAGSPQTATYNDFAILARANDTLVPFIKALERAGLPYQFIASRGLYSKPVILDVISYFKLLDNYHESSAVFRILNLPFFEIPDADVAKITQYSHKKTKSLFEAMEELPLIPGISAKTQEKIAFLLSLTKKHSFDAREKSVSEILLAFLEDSGYLKFLVGNDEQEKLELLNQFLKKIKAFEEANLEPSLRNFMEEINLELESGERGKLEIDPEQGPEMIKVMTIHGAKGLEFKYVFLVSMVDKRFPTIERKDPIELPDELIKDIKSKGDVHLQEERRICYVAITRAKKELYFTSAEDYGGKQTKKLSRFLTEMGFGEKSEARNPKSETNLKFKNLKLNSNLKFKISNFQKFLPQHFSYSQLAAFEKCPLQYKFGFILKVPAKGKAMFSFGKTMHNTLHEFLKQANKSSSLQQESLFKRQHSDILENVGMLGFDELAKIYEKNWIDEWYETKKQKEEYYKLGKKIIKDFFEDWQENQPQILKINNSFALETPFNLKVGEHTLFGVIDRIDELPDGIRIIDYKTGKAKEKLGFEDKEQLLIYQIAAEEVLKLKPKELIYYYLEENKKISFLGTDAEVKMQKEKIMEEIEKIKNSEFEPTPGWQCQFCDFRDICDFAQR